jgi:hypothetical protein
MQFPVRELSIRVVDENVENVGRRPVSERVRITKWNGKSDVRLFSS